MMGAVGAEPGLPGGCDAVVIGAGIAGLTTALELAERGLDVVVVERARVASEQSGRNAGFLRTQGRLAPEMPLAVDSVRMLAELPARYGSDPDFIQGGNLILATTDEQVARYQSWLDGARGLDHGARIVSPREIADLVPALHGSWKGGLFTASDAQTNPRSATRLVAEAAQRAGARVIEGVTVDHIDVTAGQVTGVVTRRGWIQAPLVICAAGIHTSAMLADLGLELPVKLLRGSGFRTHPVAPITRTALIVDGSFVVRQDAHGVLYGSSLRGHVDVTRDTFKRPGMFLPMYLKNIRSFVPHLTLDTVRSFLPNRSADRFEIIEPAVAMGLIRRYVRALGEMFPDSGPLVVDQAWAGVMDATVDGLPVIEALTSPQGLLVGTGQSGHGFGIGPAMGKALADLATTGRSDYDLSAFRLGRFDDGSYTSAYSVI